MIPVDVTGIHDFASCLAHEPKHVATAAGGAGFCEPVDFLLDVR